MYFPISNLNDRQLDKMSDITGDLGLASVVSIILPSVFGKLNQIEALLGFLATIIFWAISIWLRR